MIPSGFFVNHGGDVTEARYDALAAAVGPSYDQAVSRGRRSDAPQAHPDIYQLALSRLGAAPDHGVAVDDTRHWVVAAQSAGLAYIAIPNPFVAPDAVAIADLVLLSADAMPLTEALPRSLQGRVRRLRLEAARSQV